MTSSFSCGDKPEWPEMQKACGKMVITCLSSQQAKSSKKLRFPLQTLELSDFNKLVAINHQTKCMTDKPFCAQKPRQKIPQLHFNCLIVQIERQMNFHLDDDIKSVGESAKHLVCYSR